MENLLFDTVSAFAFYRGKINKVIKYHYVYIFEQNTDLNSL